ncbi:MAG: class I SAM-dependent rRNA methyltransferase [Rhodospirillales bacterium]|nr:class I SAM-dependent rRNA methyltransferase [Rhodospirillales bacterium]
MTLSPYPVVKLQSGRHKRVKGGHPWAYSNEIVMDAAAKALPPGGLVRLESGLGEALGVAMFNPHPLIAARLVSRDPAAIINADFLAQRLAAAIALREQLYSGGFYRLIHAEADGLPGLIVDRFGGTVVVQANAAGIDCLLPELLAAIDATLAPRAVVLRNDSGARASEGLDSHVRVAKGNIAGPVELAENGGRFLADIEGGQKTGWFYDQRENRVAVAALAAGARVLDLYAYGGGFAIAAARAGAKEAVAIDRSAAALDLAGQAAALNGVSDACRFARAEAFAELERLASAGERFDIVVADPPAFVKSKKDLAAGARGYRKLARLAAALVTPSGFMFIASCSHNVDVPLFAEQVRRGIADAGREGRILRSSGAAADHPVHPHLPESAYLKAQLLQLG